MIIKYIAERLCKVPFTNVAYVQGSLLNEGSLINHQSSASYDCTVRVLFRSAFTVQAWSAVGWATIDPTSVSHYHVC